MLLLGYGGKGGRVDAGLLDFTEAAVAATLEAAAETPASPDGPA